MNPEELASTIRARLAPAAHDSAPARITTAQVPDHDLLRQVGRGNYGEVWLARSVTGQLRAVKVVWRRNFSSERPYEREFRGIVQFEPISRSHPGLIDVLHVGRDDAAGFFYYVMELADDANPDGNHVDDYTPRTLAADIRSSERLAFTDVLQLGVRIADALGHLHRNGLVHRDIKPSNIIFIGDHPKLADIGSVTGIDEARSFVGTEGFIPPEGPGSERADLFSLGRLLYEAATGKDRCDFPELPSDLDCWPAAEREGLLELNEVLTRACAPDPSDRHANAAELARELNLLLAGRSVRKAYGLERRLRRAKWTSAVAVAIGIVALCSAWFLRWQKGKSDARAELEGALRARAEAAESDGRQLLYSALLEQARATVRSGEMGQRVKALDAVRRAAAISNTVELRREALAAFALPDLRFEKQLPTGLDCTLVALDPKFERLALARGAGPVEICSVPDMRVLATLPASTNRAATFGCWSPDGRFLAVRGTEGYLAHPTAEVWEVASARRVLLVPETLWASFSFHPRLAQMVAASGEDSVAFWDLKTGEIIKRFAMGGRAQLIEYSSNGEKLAVSRQVGTKWVTSVVEAESGAESKVVTGPRFNSISWDQQDRWVALIANNEVHLHDQKTDQTRLLGHHKREARSAVFSPDGRYLFTGADEQEIICWDLRTMERAFSIGLQSAQLQFRADGLGCAITTSREILLHSFERPVPHRELVGDLGGGVSRAVISPNGHWLAAGGRERLGLWDLSDSNDASSAAVFVDARNPTPFFSTNNSELFAFWNDGFARWQINPIAVGQTNSIARWQISPNSGAAPSLTSLPVYKPSRIYSAGFAGQTLLLGLPDGAMHVPGTNISTGPGTLKNVGYADGQISPNGAWFALRKASQGYVVIHNVNPWYFLKNVACDAQVLAVSFTPQNDELAIATYSSVTFLDTATWEERRRFPVALDRNAQLLFAPDGSFWLVHNARLAALHDARTFETRLALPPGALPLAISPDGRDLAITPDTRRVQVWDLAQIRANLGELGLDWESR